MKEPAIKAAFRPKGKSTSQKVAFGFYETVFLSFLLALEKNLLFPFARAILNRSLTKYQMTWVIHTAVTVVKLITRSSAEVLTTCSNQILLRSLK